MHDRKQVPVYVVLAVFQPDRGFLEAQIASVAAQTTPVEQIVAVIADRTSEALVKEVCGRHRLDLHTVVPHEPSNSYRSFDLGLRAAVDLAPEGAVFALCDQDDVWLPEKVQRSLAILDKPGVAMVHGDAEVIDAKGRVLNRSLHRLEGRRLDASLRDLLVRNTATGMTMTMTRDVAKAALPFPMQSSLYFHHDLWLALIAGILGGTRFLRRPVVQYRQHGGNVVGAIHGEAAAPAFGSRAWRTHWAGRYSVAAYLAKTLYLRAAELVERGSAAPDRKRLADLSPYLAPKATGAVLLKDAARLSATGYLALAHDSAMLAAVQAGRLGWAVQSVLSRGLIPTLGEFDRKLFSVAPGAQPGSLPVFHEQEPEVWSADTLEDQRTTRRFDVAFSPTGPRRMVIFVPTLNPPEIFAGIATALDIGVGLAERGHEVLFVASDLPIADRERSHNFIIGRGLAPGAWTRRITLACGRRDAQIALTKADTFLATAWWTAYLARDLIAEYPFVDKQFRYLIQDYEPGFYAWGCEYALARASYDFDYLPIFNSVPLARHFQTLGVVPANAPVLTFGPAINLDRYMSVPRAANVVPRLAVYGRPKVARNLFGVCVTSLERFLAAQNIKPGEIDMVSVGQAHPDVVFAGGHRLKSLGKIPWDDYPAFLGSIDIGLSLMLSPHPSHPPLEMAAAGARVVTNTFGEKCLGTLSSSIRSVAPGVDAVAHALEAAWRDGPASLAERRIRMSALGQPLATVIDRLAVDLTDVTQPLVRAG